MTDGKSKTGQISRPAEQLRNSGVEIFSVGIGQSFSIQELQAMASEPVNQHVITLGTFTEFERLAEKMSSRICRGKCNGWWDIRGEGVMITVSMTKIGTLVLAVMLMEMVMMVNVMIVIVIVIAMTYCYDAWWL